MCQKQGRLRLIPWLFSPLSLGSRWVHSLLWRHVVREKTHLPPWPEGREDGSSTDSTGGEEGRTTGEANTQGSCVEVSYSTASSDAASPVEIRDSKGRAYRGRVSELGPCSAQRRLLKVNLEP